MSKLDTLIEDVTWEVNNDSVLSRQYKSEIVNDAANDLYGLRAELERKDNTIAALRRDKQELLEALKNAAVERHILLGSDPTKWPGAFHQGEFSNCTAERCVTARALIKRMEEES
jgi:hypothetical protein